MSESVRNPVMFLDTNVLYGELSCDLFLTLGESHLVNWDVKWSDYVLDELREHLTERIRALYPNLSDEKVLGRVSRRLYAMKTYLPQACVLEWRRVVDDVRGMVADVDDAPILAGAVAAAADYLVTSNVGDFDIPTIARRLRITVRKPGDMLCTIFESDKEFSTAALTGMLDSHRRPPRSLRELCSMLRTMPELSAFSVLLENEARARAESASLSSRRPPYSHALQPRDSRGRFARKPVVGDDDLDLYDAIWGIDGNFK